MALGYEVLWDSSSPFLIKPVCDFGCTSYLVFRVDTAVWSIDAKA